MLLTVIKKWLNPLELELTLKDKTFDVIKTDRKKMKDLKYNKPRALS